MLSLFRATRRHLLRFLPVAGAAALLPRRALAAEDDYPAKLHLIAASRPREGRMMAGIHLEMEPGWKTYWRAPGGSGIPPLFDWSGSVNLRAAEVAFPAPQRLGEEGNRYLGYKGEVVFPVFIEPENANAPVDLVLSMTYGLCERVCLPAESRAHVRLNSRAETSRDEPLIERYLARVPQAVPAGSVVRDWRVDRSGKQIEFSANLLGGIDFVVLEAPPEWGAAVPATAIPGTADRFTVAVRHLPEKFDTTPLTLTVIGRRSAVEEKHSLDG